MTSPDQSVISEQFLINQAISGAFISLIPPSWSSARLEIMFEHRDDQLPRKLKIQCPTPEGCVGVLVLTDEIYDAARKIEAFLREHDVRCNRALVSARKTRFGSWSSKTEFEWCDSSGP